MKYLVTGATGFVGERVARQSVLAGHQVNALVRTPAQAGDLAALGKYFWGGWRTSFSKPAAQKPATVLKSRTWAFLSRLVSWKTSTLLGKPILYNALLAKVLIRGKWFSRR